VVLTKRRKDEKNNQRSSGLVTVGGGHIGNSRYDSGSNVAYSLASRIGEKMTAIKNSERTIDIEAENALIDATSQLRSLGYKETDILKMAMVVLGITDYKLTKREG